MNEENEAVEEVMTRLCTGYSVTQMIYVVAALKIPDELGQGARSAAELAQVVGCDERSLYRLMRALCALNVFRELEEKCFELTPLGATLKSSAPQKMRALAMSYGTPWWWGAYSKLVASVMTGNSAFKLAHGMELFEYLRQDHDASAIFHDNMEARTSREALAVTEAFDFSGVRRIVDVGGGQGVLALTIAHANPGLSAVVFDQPSLRERAINSIAGANLQERCEFVEGDFFEAISVSADMYCLKYVLHDWPDDESVQILRNCHRAMRGEGRLLVIERVLRSGNRNVSDALFDVSMMALTGGTERTEIEYLTLLERAGFTITALFPTSANVCILEAIPSRY
jgi:ubiquinone/menaquinone biosynthesis C-methylase UbiE